MINKFCIACQTKVGKQYLLDLLTLGSVVFFLCTTLQDCWFFFFCPQSLQHSSLHVWGFSHECTLWTGGAWAQHPGGLRRSTLEWRRCDCKSQLFVRKSNIQLPSVVLKPRVWSLPMSFMGEIVLNAGPGVVFFCFFQDVWRPSRGQRRCRSAGSECIHVRVQAGWNDVFSCAAEPVSQSTSSEWGECHRACSINAVEQCNKKKWVNKSCMWCP